MRNVAIFQTFWYGETIPLYVRECMRSFVNRGHEYHIYSYTRFENIPSGVQWMNASHILPQDSVFFYKDAEGARGSVAAFANLFRYELLAKLGNWWVDADVVCLSKTEPPGKMYFGWECDDYICNAILKFPKDHPILTETLRRCQEYGTQDLKWGTTGPKLLTNVINELGLRHQGYPEPFAYPVSWKEHEALVLASEKEDIVSRLCGVPMLHLWNGRFKFTPHLDLSMPEKGSVVDELLFGIGSIGGSDR